MSETLSTPPGSPVSIIRYNGTDPIKRADPKYHNQTVISFNDCRDDYAPNPSVVDPNSQFCAENLNAKPGLCAEGHGSAVVREENGGLS